MGWVCFFVESEKFFYALNIHVAYFTHLYSLSEPLDEYPEVVPLPLQ